MADYSDTAQGAFDSIKAAGGVITFKRPPTDSVPADPDAPWEGNADDPLDFAHVAVLLPLGAVRNNAESNHRVLIPALGLPFEIQMQQEFTDAKGIVYSITAVSTLAPDPAQIILFDCECAKWPAT